MKKILFISAAILVIAACQKEPVIDRDNEYLVYTSPEKDVDFSQFRTYHIADSVLVIGLTDKPVYSKSKDAVEMVLQVRENMEKRGFTFVEKVSEANLGVQLTYVIKTERFIKYYNTPYWWLDYPGYWPAAYWGDWSGYYYPRPVVYTYTTNALLTDIVDLTSEYTEETPLEILWTSYIGGPAGGSLPHAQKRMLDAIGQAFTQSPYLASAKTE